MQFIDSDSIKRITNGDLIVQGNPEEILKSRYEEGWRVVHNLRESEQLEVEKSGGVSSVASMIHMKYKLSYGELTNNDWYILDANRH